MKGSNLIGAVAETKIAAAATALGIPVLRPIVEHGRYDLAFEVGHRLLRVQCKSASVQGDIVLVRCYTSRRTRTGMLVRGYTNDEIDGVAVYCPTLDRCFFLPVAFVNGRKQIHLRLDATRNGQSAAINWATQFDFASIDWAHPERSHGAVAQLEERRRGTPEARGSSPLSSTSVAASTDDAATVMGSHEFRNRFGHHLERAAAGESLLITRHGTPLARLGPPD